MLRHLFRGTSTVRRSLTQHRNIRFHSLVSIHRPIITPLQHTRNFWWDDADDSEKKNKNKKEAKKTKKTLQKEDTMDETASKSKPKRSPLHIGGDQRNIIDVDSSETETTSSSSSSSNSDDSITTSTSSTTSSTSSTTSDESSPAIMGEGENAPHIPSVMIIPRRGTPVFPVPELAQHLLIKDPDVVKKLEKQLITGTPYIGVFMRRGDSDIPKSSSEHDDGYEADDVIYDLDEIHNIGTLAQVAAIRQLGRFNSEDEIETDQTLDQETNSSKPKSAPIWHVMLTGHRRIRFDRNNIASTIKEQGPPMVIDIEHLSTPEYDPDDKILEATSQEMMNTIRDVLQTK